jgi:hypothetical protein
MQLGSLGDTPDVEEEGFAMKGVMLGATRRRIKPRCPTELGARWSLRREDATRGRVFTSPSQTTCVRQLGALSPQLL